MKWYENWLQVFKIGAHTDSAGNTHTWTQEDLDTIVNNYNPAEQEAPVVLGHPKTDEPAYAWVSELRAQDGILYAKLSRVDSEFSLWVEKGLYRKISIALDAELNLRHIGFLGAANPAVRGLCNDFSSGGDVYVFFSDVVYPVLKDDLSKSHRLVASELPFLGAMKRKGVENPAGEDCLSTHSVRVPQPSEMSLETCEREQAGVFGNFFKKVTFKENGFHRLSGFFKDKKAFDFKEKNMFKKQSTQEFSAKIEELERELQFAQKSQARQEFGVFLGTLHSEAKITAEDKIRLAQVFEALCEVDAACFAQSDIACHAEACRSISQTCKTAEILHPQGVQNDSTFGTSVGGFAPVKSQISTSPAFSESAESSSLPPRFTSVDAFASFLDALPPRVELKELATRENAPKGTYRTPQEELGMKIAKSIQG